MTTTRVLVTGASGFVGKHCLPELALRNCEVHAVRQNPIVGRNDNAIWHSADLWNEQQVDDLLEQVRPTYLLHLAWNTTPGVYWHSPDNFAWVEASFRLLRAFHRGGGQRAVFVGSCAEYDWSQGLCHEQDTPLRPQGVYGACKQALSLLAQTYAAQNGLSLAWARLFFMYGPGNHPQRFPGPIITSLEQGTAAPCSHGRQRRDYLAVSDVAGALSQLTLSNLVGPINIGSGEAISLQTIVQQIAEYFGRPELIRWGAVPAPANEAPLVVADVNRLQQELNWRPRTRLVDGLRATIVSQLEGTLHAA